MFVVLRNEMGEVELGEARWSHWSSSGIARTSPANVTKLLDCDDAAGHEDGGAEGHEENAAQIAPFDRTRHETPPAA